jgi:hypothetical protein
MSYLQLRKEKKDMILALLNMWMMVQPQNKKKNIYLKYTANLITGIHSR